jgi:TRAP-type C4-dicarboxylate transport system permease small subunit
MNIKKIGIILWKTLLYSQRVLMIIAVVGTTLLVFVPLVSRELGRPFAGYEEYLLLFSFWMYMMGSSHGSYEKSQITADLMSRVLKGRPRTILNLSATILTFVLGVIFMYWALTLVQWSLMTGAVSSIHKIPIVWGQFSIFAGLLISSIYNFVYMIRDVREAVICRFDVPTIEEQEVV